MGSGYFSCPSVSCCTVVKAFIWEMEIVPDTGEIRMSDIMTVFGLTGKTNIGSLVRGGPVVQKLI
jgi:hypothetical protein